MRKALFSTTLVILFFWLCWCYLCSGSVLAMNQEKSLLKPVIIIPGTGGTRLEAKLDKPSVSHWYCSKRSNWYTLWLSVVSLTSPAINCWVDNIKLLWDSETKKYSNNIGVTTRIPYSSGSTLNFEYLDTSLKYGNSDYFYTLVQSLVEAGGIRNVSIRGSPFDFRYAPSSADSGQWLNKFTALVEDTYELNQQQKVSILSHSMGCLYSLWFLNNKSQEWKDKYILRWIPTSGVFAGAGNGVKQLLSGDVSLVPLPGLSPLTVRDEQRSYESNLLLLPSTQVWMNQTLVSTPLKNYSSYDYEILFSKSNFENGFERYQLIGNLTANLIPPGVDTVHYYGVDVDTPCAFHYSSDNDFNESPDIINCNGDGTVPLKSLQSAHKWKAQNKGKSFVEKMFKDQSHTGILKFQDYINDIINLLR